MPNYHRKVFDSRLQISVQRFRRIRVQREMSESLKVICNYSQLFATHQSSKHSTVLGNLKLNLLTFTQNDVYRVLHHIGTDAYGSVYCQRLQRR
jgi:hypothetical protein